MNKRLKIYGIIFGLVYFFIIGEKIISDFAPSFVAGFKAGYNAGVDSMENGNDADEILQTTPEILSCYVHPLGGYNSFPTQIKNLKNNTLLNVRTSEFMALVPHFERPLWLKIASAVRSFFSFLMLAILIYVPILIFKIVRSVVKNAIFDTINIRRIKRIAWALIALFALSLYFSVFYALDAQNIVQFADYKVIFKMTMSDYMPLLFGAASLLFAEILKISTAIKEENDLTV